MDVITIAAVSCMIQFGKYEGHIDHNLAQIDKWAANAAAQGADLVLFNETSIHGYWQNWQLRGLAEPLDGPIVQRVTEIAAEHDIIICAGMIEAASGKAYNTHVVVGPEGLIAYHRKSSLASGEEKYFDAGNDTNVFDIKGCKIGIAICFESIHPETCQALAEKGAEVILAPYANGVTAQDIAAGKRPYFNTRAKDNKAYYVACDQCGVDWADPAHPYRPGAVCFVNPLGEIIETTPLEETKEHMIVRELDLTAVRELRSEKGLAGVSAR